MPRKDWESSLRTLYVVDLKDFLRQYGMNTAGRKSDLLIRVTNVLSSGCVNVEQMEEFVQSRARHRPRPPHHLPHHVPSLHPLTGLPTQAPMYPSPPKQPLADAQLTGPRVKTSSVPTCSAFNQLECNLVGPELLLGVASGSVHNKYNSCMFRLNEDQGRKVTAGTHRIMLRLCRDDKKSAPCSDNYPFELRLSINTIRTAIPGYNPELCRYAEYTYHCSPIDITADIRPEASNQVEVFWKKPLSTPFSHIIALQLTRTRTVADLLAEIKSRSCSKSTTERLLKSKLRGSKDDSLAVTTDTLQVSLLCPLTKARLTLPCRDLKCSHVQCFDTEPYLLMNSKRESWKCPVCDQRVSFNTLVVDDLMKEVLESLDSKGCSSVTFDKDAVWRPSSSSETITTTNLLLSPADTTLRRRQRRPSCDGDEEGDSCVIDLTSSPLSASSTSSTDSTVTIGPAPSDDVIMIL